MEEKVQKVRPYWHVDMKWITGILLLISLSLSIALFNLYKLSGPGHAIELATYTFTSAFSQKGLDDTSEIAEFKKKVIAGGGYAKPIPAFDITITAKDLETKTPRELRLSIFRQIVEPVYYKEAEGIREKVVDPEMKNGIEKQMGLFKYLNERTHKKLGSFFRISVAVTAALLALFVFFSAGAGRFINPAFVFIFVAAPGLFLSIVLKNGGGAKDQPAQQAENIGQMVSGIMKIIGPQISGLVMKPYAYLALSGLGLIVGGIGYKVVRRVKAKTA